MRMTGLEKLLINRRKKAERNVQKLRLRLGGLDAHDMHDALKVGCGIGVASAFLAGSYGMRVEGTDFDPEQIQAAQAMNQESDLLRFSVADAARLDFEDSSFDLVVSQNVFHHVPNWTAAAGEVSRVLRPNGYLIWYDLTFPRWVVTVFRPLLGNYGLYTFEQVRAAFAKHALEPLVEERVAHGPFGHYEMVFRKRSG